MSHQDLSRLCRRLHHSFQRLAWLEQALTHRSAGANNNERLEFLGDSILSLVISNALFTQFPDHNEGELSRLRANLVKGETLADLALELDLGSHLRLGQGELKSGGFRRSSILADALEASFAAICLDGGFAAAERSILSLYQSRLNDPALFSSLKDPKTQLQEFLQSKKMPLPLYELMNVTGEDHEQQFEIRCRIAGTDLVTTGVSDNRRKAEQLAAKAMLQHWAK